MGLGNFDNENNASNAYQKALEEINAGVFKHKIYDHKGFYFNKNENKFRCYIRINKKQIHLGYAKTEHDAIELVSKYKSKIS